MQIIKTLIDIYLNAIELTENASQCLMNSDQQGASLLLLKRQKLLREIQKNIACPPPWGADVAQDKAAIDYIKADQHLRELIAINAK